MENEEYAYEDEALIVPDIPDDANDHDLSEQAMIITNPQVAKLFLEKMVQRHLRFYPGLSIEGAETKIKNDLGYFAGYYNDDTRYRVEKLFDCVHPIFGKISETGPISTQKAFEMGMKQGAEHQKTMMQPYTPRDARMPTKDEMKARLEAARQARRDALAKQIQKPPVPPHSNIWDDI